MDDDRQLVLYLVVCGAPPAADVEPFVVACQAVGWDVCVVPTRVGRRFLDTGRLAKLTGHPLRDDYKRPTRRTSSRPPTPSSSPRPPSTP